MFKSREPGSRYTNGKREAMKRYYLRNRERILNRMKEYYKKNKLTPKKQKDKPKQGDKLKC